MNVYDATRMADVLASVGYGEASDPESADLVLLNTCHIREHAAEKIFSELGRLALLKAEKSSQNKTLTIGVAGCVAQASGGEIIRRQPKVDLVVGPQSYHRLPELLRRAAEQGSAVDTSFPEKDKFGELPSADAKRTRSRGVTAFLTVQEGCDKFCSFCVVPYTRGAEASRSPEGILAEARRLADAGVVEFTLLGQNVNGYAGESSQGEIWSLARLIEAIEQEVRPLRIRYTTSHPRDMSADLIEAHRERPSLMPFLHLPVQSGSDRILAKMNRRHTAKDYLRLVEAIRMARPDIALSSDFIVGFPGETEDDFTDTLDLISAVGFASAFTFKYSPRPGTPAADADGQLPEDVKRERLGRIQDLLEKQRRAFNNCAVGTIREVLFEKRGLHPGQIVGKTPHMQAVHVEGPEALIGAVRPVKILRAGSNSFHGRLLVSDDEDA